MIESVHRTLSIFTPPPPSPLTTLMSSAPRYFLIEEAAMVFLACILVWLKS